MLVVQRARSVGSPYSQSLLDKAPVPAISALNTILSTTVEESNAQRQAGSPIWYEHMLIQSAMLIANQVEAT